MTAINKWETSWSGSYPNLCSGQWSLYKNGELLDIAIPFNGEDEYDGSPAYTEGSYFSWHFGGESGWEECWEQYVSGSPCDAWCAANADWLRTFADESEWEDIFYAFQANDWRHGSCGGCI